MSFEYKHTCPAIDKGISTIESYFADIIGVFEDIRSTNSDMRSEAEYQIDSLEEDLTDRENRIEQLEEEIKNLNNYILELQEENQRYRRELKLDYKPSEEY